MPDLAVLAGTPVCRLTTTGRVTRRPRTIEIWFALADTTLYMLSGGGDRSDWVRNLVRTPTVSVRIGNTRLRGTARIVAAGREDALARRAVLEKYEPRHPGDLSGWGRTALPVAVDLHLPAVPPRG